MIYSKFTDWLIQLAVDWILAQVANGGADTLADKLEKMVLPWIHKQKDEFFVRLKQEAAKTGTPLDDAVVKALEVFTEALIPKVS